MTAVLDYLKTHLYLAAVPIFLLILLLRFYSKQSSQRKKQEEMRQLQRRDEALNEALRNPRAGQSAGGRVGPMEIAWDEQAADSTEKRSSVMMTELVERSAYARRKYVFRADETVSIGSGSDNRLLLSREGVAERHCVIFLRSGKPCVKSAAGARTILKRGRETAMVSEGGIYLNNGDHIQVGTADIQFRTFRA